MNDISFPERFTEIKNIDFYVTTECGEGCGHCMAHDLMREQGIKHMDKELFFDIVDSIEGIESIHIAGPGESFKYRYIFEAMEYASDRVGEVRINSNGHMVPKRSLLKNNERDVQDVFETLPENVHIFMSLDEYHMAAIGKRDYIRRISAIMKYSEMYDIKVTFNLRTDSSHRVNDSIKMLRYQRSMGDDVGKRFNKIFNEGPRDNRILKMGRARAIKDSRYVELDKMISGHFRKPMIGVMYDGTVVSGFIASYLPKLFRPKFCEFGNVKEEPLGDIIERCTRFTRNQDPILASMIDDMKIYPFAIANPDVFDWTSDALKDKRAELTKNTLDRLIESLNDSQVPIFRLHGINKEPRLVSEKGVLAYDIDSGTPDAADLRDIRDFYGDMFRQQVQIGNSTITKKDADEKNILKLCTLFNYLSTTMYNKKTLDHGSPDFWKYLLRGIGLPEEEWREYVTMATLGNDYFGTGIYSNFLNRLGINETNYDKF